MRPYPWAPAALCAVTALLAGCAHPHPPAPSPSAAKPAVPTTGAITPANIKRVVRDLPPGYEMTSDIPGGANPRAIWNLDADAQAKPAPCARLADPGEGRDGSAQGLSGSGGGGIVDAVVVALPGPVDFPQDLLEACAQWTMTDGRTTAAVRRADAPHIDGADTLGMVTDTRSKVESGSEIDSRTYTFTAYLGNYYVFTTLTTDPGSVQPALPAQFAADLLVKTVSTLRG